MNTENKIEIKLFTSYYIYELQRKVEVHKETDNYLQEKFPWEEKFPKGSTGIFLPENFDLRIPDDKRNLFDLENSISLYENLAGMDETKASDPRVWTYLSHVIFWNYMRKRWPIEGMGNPIGRIIDRYHMKYLKLESLVRNGISRLWWYTHLTIDDTKNDKYEKTRILLSKADISVGILERSFGSNNNIRMALLEFLSKNPEVSEKEDTWRNLFIQVNILGGVKNLPFLSSDEIGNNLLKIKNEVI